MCSVPIKQKKLDRKSLKLWSVFWIRMLEKVIIWRSV